jgi:hypothetical protein
VPADQDARGQGQLCSLLSRLPETGMTAADPAMCDALEDLEESFRRAHTLVAACQDQESTTVCIYCTARRQARRLRRVQDDISQKVMLVVFATSIQTTIVLTSIMRTGEQVTLCCCLPAFERSRLYILK